MRLIKKINTNEYIELLNDPKMRASRYVKNYIVTAWPLRTTGFLAVFGANPLTTYWITDAR